MATNLHGMSKSYKLYNKYKRKYLRLKYGGHLNRNRTKIEYCKIETVDYPSLIYNQIEQRLKALYKICEPDENDFNLIDPSKIIVGYDNSMIQSFVILTDTSVILEQFPEDFEEKGGILAENMKGLFITSVCGNIKKYYGLLTPLFEYIYNYCKQYGYSYLLLHVSRSRPVIRKKYEKQGFIYKGSFVQVPDNEVIDIMIKLC